MLVLWNAFFCRLLSATKRGCTYADNEPSIPASFSLCRVRSCPHDREQTGKKSLQMQHACCKPEQENTAEYWCHRFGSRPTNLFSGMHVRFPRHINWEGPGKRRTVKLLDLLTGMPEVNNNKLVD